MKDKDELFSLHFVFTCFTSVCTKLGNQSYNWLKAKPAFSAFDVAINQSAKIPYGE